MSKETVNNDVDAFLSELETIDNDRRAERAASRGLAPFMRLLSQRWVKSMLATH